MEQRWLIGGPALDDQVPPEPEQVKQEIIDPVIKGTYEGKTADQWRDELLSPDAVWADVKRIMLCSQVASQDGIMEFPGLFDLSGQLIPQSRYIKNRKSGKWVWIIGDGPGAQWFNPSQTRQGATRRARDAAKGYAVGTVRRRAYVATGDHNGRLYYYIAEVPGGAIEIVDDGSLGRAYGDR